MNYVNNNISPNEYNLERNNHYPNHYPGRILNAYSGYNNNNSRAVANPAANRNMNQQYRRMLPAQQTQRMYQNANQPLNNMTQAKQPGLHNRFNGPLPDGVKLQPIDENMFKQLKGSVGDAQSPVVAVPPSPGLLPKPDPQIATGEIIDVTSSPANTNQDEAIIDTLRILGSIIQNERNAAIFYTYLLKKTVSKNSIELLQDIVQSSKSRCDKLMDIYDNISGSKFEIKESRIDNTKPFKDSLIFASIEERNVIRELIELNEKFEHNEVIYRRLNSLMYQKINDLQVINLLINY